MITPNSSIVIEGEGMPNQKTPSSKGKLIVTFNVKFPQTLSPEQQEQVKAIFSQVNYWNPLIWFIVRKRMLIIRCK